MKIHSSKAVGTQKSKTYTSTSIEKDKVFQDTFHAIKGQNGQSWLLISWHVHHIEQGLWWPINRCCQVLLTRDLKSACGPPRSLPGEVISHALLVNIIYNPSMMQDHRVRRREEGLSFTFLSSISKISTEVYDNNLAYGLKKKLKHRCEARQTVALLYILEFIETGLGWKLIISK